MTMTGLWARGVQVVLALAGLLSIVQAAGPAAMSPDQWRQARYDAAHRQRRVIMDDDGGGVVYRLREATAQALLDDRTTELLGTDVDTISFCTWSSGFGMFTHLTKVGEIFQATHADERDNLRGKRGFSWNRMPEFIEKGIDPLTVMVGFCRQHDIEILWNMRMNDTHDSVGYWYGPPCVPQIKKDHPEWLFGTYDNPPPVTKRWSGVNYAVPEVRDLAFRFFEEVCENYDVDGFIMDFYRHPIFFKTHVYGGECTQEECDMMTQLLARLRKMADEVGRRRGRPFVIGVRTPDSVEYCKAIGLDLVRWMEDDLIDILIATGYARFNRWEYSVELGHRYDVPVYACLSEPRVGDKEAKTLRDTKEGYKARAANIWGAGADGLMLFNRTRPAFYCLGNPLALQAMDKVYTTGARGAYGKWELGYWFPNALERFFKRKIIYPAAPKTIEPGATEVYEIRVADDLVANRGRGLLAQVELQVRMQNLSAPEQLTVTVNDTPVASGSLDGYWCKHQLANAVVKKGYNTVALTLSDGATDPVSLEDIVLWVRY